MNQQKAKALRGLVRNMQVQGIIPAGDWAVYGNVQHKVTAMIVTVMKEGKTADGHKEMQPGVEIHNSVTLDPKCPKGIYRRMKKHGAAAVLAGQA